MVLKMPKFCKLSLFACFFGALSMTVALKCFRCGKYTPDGAGSVLPCYAYNETDLKECHSRDKYCLKYLNKGIVVRDCAWDCKPGVQELSEFFCCQEDGCNSASYPTSGWTILLGFGFTILNRYWNLKL